MSANFAERIVPNSSNHDLLRLIMQTRGLRASSSKLDLINNHLTFLLKEMKTLEHQCESLRTTDNPRTIMIIKSEIECQRSLVNFIVYISNLTRPQTPTDDFIGR